MPYMTNDSEKYPYKDCSREWESTVELLDYVARIIRGVSRQDIKEIRKGRRCRRQSSSALHAVKITIIRSS